MKQAAHTSALFGVDVSYYQRVIDGTYPHGVFICRVHSGYREDANFRANRDAANKVDRIKVKVAYIVPVKGMSVTAVVDLCKAQVPSDWVVMVDAESGPGFMGPGNNSVTFNALREALVSQWAGGNRRRVIGYANTGDWASCWPQRGDVPMVVAKYSSTPSDLIGSAQCIGWQYSDGDAKWPVPSGYPRSTPPFGPCDHNVFGFASADAMALWFGTGETTQPDDSVKVDDDMAKLGQTPDGRLWKYDGIWRTWVQRGKWPQVAFARVRDGQDLTVQPFAYEDADACMGIDTGMIAPRKAD